MAFNIFEFKTRGLSGGGARPSLFQVNLIPPAQILSPGVPEKFTFTCSASQIPSSTLGSVPVPYFGRTIKLAGDRTFDDWSVTVLNDEDFAVRTMFEQWSSLINTHVSNLKVAPLNSYKSTDALVTQFSKDGSVLRQYSFVGIFPVDVSSMDLDWEAVNRIQTFNVTFAYDYWVPYRSTAAGAAPVPSVDTGEPGNGSAGSSAP